MNWEEWDKAYPVPEVYEEPQYIIETFSNRMDAEQFKDALEIANERGGFNIVLYMNVYYVFLKINMEHDKNLKVNNIFNHYEYWTSPPPKHSARLLYWVEKVESGWKPNKRIRAFGYDEASKFYGVYIWEYLYVLRPILYWREKDSLGYAMAIDWINRNNKNEF